MALGSGSIVAGKRLDTEDIVRSGMVGAEAQRSLSFAHDVRPAPLLLRLHRSRQMFLDGRRHDAQ
jgi:hypothetical protein